MQQLYVWIALDATAERRREAAASRVGQVVGARRGSSDPFGRRAARAISLGLAHSLAGFTRGSAATVRRLDACVADDLGRSLAPCD